MFQNEIQIPKSKSISNITLNKKIKSKLKLRNKIKFKMKIQNLSSNLNLN